MVKSKKKLLFVLSMILLLAMSISLLVACDDDNNAKPGEYNVTFMVKENGNGAWKEVTTLKSNAEGVVTLPKDPVVPGYSFRAWYKDEACQNKFDGTGVSADMKVYAFLSDKIVSVKIKGADGGVNEVKNQTVADLNKLEAAEAAKAKTANLTFDGFYTNEGYTTKFDINSETKELYARYAAKVEFYNGYENLVEKLINPGEKVAAPKAEDIKKDYMDAEGISFVSNADRKTPFNFNDVISCNTVVRINWQSPFLEIKVIDGTDTAMINGINWTSENGTLIDSFQVVSIPSKVIVKDVEYKVLGTLVTPYESKALKKIIIQEGIEFVEGISGSGILKTSLESVELPTTLKYLEDSFNNVANVTKDIVLPEGLLAVYNCFWNDYQAGVVNATRNGGYDFDVKIPSTVKNIVLVPNNLVYAEGSTFYNEGNFAMNNDPEYGKTVVGIVQDAVSNNNLVIPSGVEALQVGVFHDIKCDFISLPSSFKKVAYNLEKSEHPTYLSNWGRMSIRAAVNTPDANPSESGMSTLGYSLIGNLDDYKYVLFDAAEYPVGMNKFAFTDRVSNGNESVLTPFDQLEKKTIVFVAKKSAGEPIDITVTATNTMLNNVKEVVIHDVLSGDTLTQLDLLLKSDLTEEKLGYKFKVNSIKQFGIDYDFSKVVEHNLYLEIDYAFAATGFTTEEDNNGNLLVTGFDQATAQDLKTNENPEVSTYLVAIPSEINGKPVVGIKDGAFKDNKQISRVYIANNVKTIGKQAFMNCKNLEYVCVAAGGLEVIGDEAFKYAGAIQNTDTGAWDVNPELSKISTYKNLPSLYIEFPLATLKTVGSEAFNTPAIREFASVPSEKERTVFYSIWIPGVDKIVEGEFYKFGNEGLVKYTGKGTITVNGTEAERIMIDYVATVPNSYQGESVAFGSPGDFAGGKMVSATIKSGSVYLYYNGRCGLCFALLDKVEKNAFVYLNSWYTEVDETTQVINMYVMKPDADKDCWLKKETFVEQADAKYVEGNIFEDGWFMGQDNTLNTFVDHIDISTGNFPGM